MCARPSAPPQGRLPVFSSGVGPELYQLVIVRQFYHRVVSGVL